MRDRGLGEPVPVLELNEPTAAPGMGVLGRLYSPVNEGSILNTYASAASSQSVLRQTARRLASCRRGESNFGGEMSWCNKQGLIICLPSRVPI